MVGLFSPKDHNRSAPINAAMTARAEVKKIGLNAVTAMRVAGREALKITTPRNPLHHPAIAEP